jgi:proton glutamate symport protein
VQNVTDKKTRKPYFLFISILLFSLAAVLWVGQHYNFFQAPDLVSIILKWLGLAFLVLYGVQKRSLTTWIFIGMAIGTCFGHDFPHLAQNANVLSKIFLKLIKTIIAPLLFSTLVVGIAGHSNIKKVGRMGLKALIYFEVVTTIALAIGLIVVNVAKPGVGIHAPPVESQVQQPEVKKQTVADIILHIFPENIAKSVAEGEVLQIVVFSILFGIALAMIKPEKRQPVLSFLDGLSQTMFKFTNIIMYFAPIGVGAAIAYTVGHMGLSVLLNLIGLLLTLYVALIVFILGVLLPIALIFRVPIKKFVRAVAEPVSIAFATTSSESALPRAMEEMANIGVPQEIVSFVLPTGYSFNLDGTTLYLSLASIFVAQAAGIHLNIPTQIIMGLTLMLTSKGVAGIPRASLVILLGTAASFNLPVWPIFLILGIDELMDMARTATNVLGNCLATVVIAKWEGEFHPDAHLNLTHADDRSFLQS